MSGVDFEPFTGQLGIAGSSYRLQIGLINEKWAVRLLKSKIIIEIFICKENFIKDETPNQDMIVGWVLRTVIIPNMNSWQIKRTVQNLMKQLEKNKGRRRVIASIKDIKEVELEKVPKSESRKPIIQGWETIPQSSDSVKVKKVVNEVLDKYTCFTCGFQMSYCTKCGTELINDQVR
jgi:hypothetical protein